VKEKQTIENSIYRAINKVRPAGSLGIVLAAGFAVAFLLMLLSAKLIEDVVEKETDQFDQTVYSLLHTLHSPSLTKDVIFLTNMGSATRVIPIFLVIFLILLFLRRRLEAFMLTIALGGSGLFNYLLKVTFHRARPDIEHLVEAGGYSFPSGHAMNSFVFYGMIGYLLWYHFRHRKLLRWVFPLVFLSFAVCIGLSRIYLGVHFASDVVAGFTIGGTWLIACILGLQVIRWYYHKSGGISGKV
jgi:undecaprenyl-diphosphatase